MEIWKNVGEIKGFENFFDYEVSTMGRVKSLKRGKEKIMKIGIGSDGYMVIRLCSNGKYKTIKVHKLIALAFIPNNDKNKDQINHIDEDKSNNNVDNLEWCSRVYNNNYGTRTERMKEKVSKKVYCLELDKIFSSTREAERFLGISCSNISRCCNHEKCYKTASGYHWFYIDDVLFSNNMFLEMEENN